MNPAYLKDLYELTKPRITLLVLVIAFTGMYMANASMPNLELMFFTLLGLALASSSSSSLNNYIDRGIDLIMERTKNRSLPQGRVSPKHALVMGIIMGLSSFVLLAWKVNVLTASLSTFALVSYILIYTIWLKRTSEHCTVIGGVAGALPPVLGLTAVNNEIGTVALIMFGILFMWQPPHFWALALMRAEEYKAAGIPMLPVAKGPEVTKKQMLIYTILLMPCSILPWWFGMSGNVFLGCAIVLGAVYLGWTIVFIRAEFSATASRKLFLFSIFYIAALYSAMIFDCLPPISQ